MPFFFTLAKIGFQKLADLVLQKKLLEKLSFLKAGLNHVGKVVSEYFTWINQSMKALFTHLNHRVISSIKRMIYPFQKGTDFLRNRLKKLSQGIQGVSLKIQALQSNLLNIIHKAYQKSYNSLNGLKIVFQKIYQMTILLKKPFQIVNKSFKEIIKKSKILLENGKKWIERPLKYFSAKTIQTTELVKDWVNPYVNKMTEFLKKKTQKWGEKTKKIAESVQSKVENLFKMISQPLINLSFSILKQLQPIFLFANPSNHWHRFKEKKKKFFDKRRDQLSRKLKMIQSSIGSGTRIVIQFIQKQRIKLMDLLKRVFIRILETLKSTPRYVWKCTKQAARLSIRFIKTAINSIHHVFYALRVFYAWMCAFFRYGLQFDRMLTDKIAKWTSLNKNLLDKID
jgi:hypothetical protein